MLFYDQSSVVFIVGAKHNAMKYSDDWEMFEYKWTFLKILKYHIWYWLFKHDFSLKIIYG